jgi:hypothetical protein
MSTPEPSRSERRYRRLLALFPRDHRRQHGEEMLGVLMAGAGDRTRPSVRDTADLLWAAVRLHVRRVFAADGGIDHRDVLAIVSLFGPVVLLAGATTGLHELAWFVRVDGPGAFFDMPWGAFFPDAPVWVIWLAVAVLGVLRMRRAAAVGAWLGTAGFLALMFFAPSQHWWFGLDAGWVELGALTAVALTWSPGPARGRELVHRSGMIALAASVVGAVLAGVFGYGDDLWDTVRVVLPVAGAVVACAPWSRAGRRAALVLALPVIPVLMWEWALPQTGLYVHLAYAPDGVVAAVYLGVPLLLLLALGGLPRRVRRRGTPVA